MKRAEAEKEMAEMAGIDTKDIVLMTSFSPVPFANKIMSSNEFVQDKYKRFFLYNKESGLWAENAEQYIRSTLRINLMGDEQQKKKYIEEIISYIKDVKHDDEFEMDNCPYLIAFGNKVYDLRDGFFYDFKSEFRLTNKLDIEINEEISECPEIDKFFEESIGKEHKQVLYDLMAYTLFKSYPYQKIFFIYGPASTGKSVYMDLLEKFLGESNRCSVEPKQIQKDKHATSQMLYKLANIVSDINYDDLDNITQVKKLSGGDTMTIRQMYKDPFNAKIYAKQIYSTNKLPVVKEKTNAWYRRVYLIEFSNIISSGMRDPFLLNKMTTEKEMMGLAHMCLKSLKDMYNNNFVFEFDMDEEIVAELYEELSNPILMFANDNCSLGKEEWCYKFELEERLNNWLKCNHFPTQTKSQINQYMRDNYNESIRPSPDRQKTYRVWTGLGWKSSHNPINTTIFNRFNGKRVYKKKPYTVESVLQTPVNPLNPLSSVKSDKINVSLENENTSLNKMDVSN